MAGAVVRFFSSNASFVDHFRWFEPFVMQWLNENDDVSLEYLHGAFKRDKQDGVMTSLESYLPSLVFYDIF